MYTTSVEILRKKSVVSELKTRNLAYLFLFLISILFSICFIYFGLRQRKKYDMMLCMTVTQLCNTEKVIEDYRIK